MSIAEELSENRGFAPASSGGAAVGGARLARRRAARSTSERAAAMDCVGNRFRLSGRLEKIESLRRGARRGAGRQAEMAEDFDNHRRIFDSGDDLQGTAAVGALFDVDIEGASFILHLLQWVCPRRWLLCSRQMRRARREVGIAIRRGHCRCGP